nr:MAG TPA: hypothetical protein [Bacteriophage sp.]
MFFEKVFSYIKQVQLLYSYIVLLYNLEHQSNQNQNIL